MAKIEYIPLQKTKEQIDRIRMEDDRKNVWNRLGDYTDAVSSYGDDILSVDEREEMNNLSLRLTYLNSELN